MVGTEAKGGGTVWSRGGFTHQQKEVRNWNHVSSLFNRHSYKFTHTFCVSPVFKTNSLIFGADGDILLYVNLNTPRRSQSQIPSIPKFLQLVLRYL